MFETHEFKDFELSNKRKIRGRDVWKLLPPQVAKDVRSIRLVKQRDKEVFFALYCHSGICYEYVPFSGKVVPNGSGYLSGYKKFIWGIRSFVQYECRSEVQRISRRRVCLGFCNRLLVLWDVIQLEDKEGEEWLSKKKYDRVHCW